MVCLVWKLGMYLSLVWSTVCLMLKWSRRVSMRVVELGGRPRREKSEGARTRGSRTPLIYWLVEHFTTSTVRKGAQGSVEGHGLRSAG